MRWLCPEGGWEEGLDVQDQGVTQQHSGSLWVRTVGLITTGAVLSMVRDVCRFVEYAKQQAPSK